MLAGCSTQKLRHCCHAQGGLHLLTNWACCLLLPNRFGWVVSAGRRSDQPGSSRLWWCADTYFLLQPSAQFVPGLYPCCGLLLQRAQAQ